MDDAKLGIIRRRVYNIRFVERLDSSLHCPMNSMDDRGYRQSETKIMGHLLLLVVEQ